MRRKVRAMIISENVHNFFIIILLIAGTIFFIQISQHMNSLTLTSHDIRLNDQLTQKVVRSNHGFNENKISGKWNSTSVGQNLTYVKQLNYTEDKYRHNSNVIFNHLVPLENIVREVNETDINQLNETIRDSHVKLNGSYIEPNFNRTNFLEIKEQHYYDQVGNNLAGHVPDVSIKIVKNHTAVSRMLSNRTKNDALILKSRKRPNYCPLWPTKLVGRMDMEVIINSTDLSEASRQLIGEGGIFKPVDCSPRERTAIIIPYRDRDKHLQVLLSHLHKVLQRQMIEYGIYVIEMAFPTQFNRGLLANVGFLTASSVHSYTCYIIHDVDLLVMDDRNMYRCGRVPRHLTASNTKYNHKLPYLAYFGGVVAFTPEQFWKVNGFSNLYFGWGGEDDDMVYRIFHTKQHFSRPKPKIGGYTAIEHSSDFANPVNPNRKALVNSALKRMSVDGVRTVVYQRLALEFKPLYTWVYVSVQEAKIMNKYQDYLQEAD